MANKPLVSVIIVVYNSGDVLEQAINSVSLQTYPNVELVIIDGGSTDNTHNVITKHSKQIAYFSSEKDNGIYDAMNKGIKAATGDWLFFLGADDALFENHTISNLFDEASNYSNAQFIYGDVMFSSNRSIVGGSRNYTQLIEKNIPHQAIFYNKSIFEKTGYYNAEFKILADWDLNLRIFRDSSIVKKYIPGVITLFNNKGGASNVTIDSNFLLHQLAFFTKTEKRAATDPLLQPYNFYAGIIHLFKYKKLKGLRYCVRSFTSGSRKFYFIMMFFKFIIYFVMPGKKLRFL